MPENKVQITLTPHEAYKILMRELQADCESRDISERIDVELRAKDLLEERAFSEQDHRELSTELMKISPMYFSEFRLLESLTEEELLNVFDGLDRAEAEEFSTALSALAEDERVSLRTVCERIATELVEDDGRPVLHPGELLVSLDVLLERSDWKALTLEHQIALSEATQLTMWAPMRDYFREQQEVPRWLFGHIQKMDELEKAGAGA